MTTLNESANRRQKKTGLINPKAQIRYFGLFGIAWIGCTLIILMTARFYADRSMNDVAVAYGISGELLDVMLRMSTRSFWVAILCVGGSGIVSFTHSVFHSHRVYGPLVPLRRMIKQLQDGDYSVRVKFRKHDELTELMHDFNALAAELERKYGTPKDPDQD